MENWLQEIAIFLAAAVVAVPLAQRLGLGSVLGYLAAGMAIGPWGLGLIGEVEEVLHIAELGVVLLLFIIGLEMQPKRLWALRKVIVGFGASQVLLSAAALGLLAMWTLGAALPAAAVLGLALALSSTAFGLQLLGERGELTSRHGRAAFAILLFQDLAVIPILALLPLLAAGEEAASLSGTLLETAKVAAVLGGMVVGGHYLLRPVFRLVAATRMPEIFTAWALLVVLGTAVLMAKLDMSVALGAFAAGVLLADSEYRHELQANIDPFKDMLLGLFFIAVGMSINLDLLWARPWSLVSAALGLLAVKVLLLYALGRRQGLAPPSARSLAATLPQGGEFAFVILGAAVADGLVTRVLSDQVVAVVILSMLATPPLVAGTAWLNRRLAAKSGSEPDFEMPESPTHPVILAGFGRVGQIIARVLRVKRIGFVALELNPNQVDFVQRFGDKVYYGDASKLELLRIAGIEQARAFVITIGDPEVSVRLARVVREQYPEVKIVASARNRRHALALLDAGVDKVLRETFLSSLELGAATLKAAGVHGKEADHAVRVFRGHDERLLAEQAANAGDAARIAQLHKEAMRELEDLFERDAQEVEADARSAR